MLNRVFNDLRNFKECFFWQKPLIFTAQISKIALENSSKIYVALPLIDELDHLPALLGCLAKQTFTNFEVFTCVNQPDDWWDDEQKLQVCLNNAETIRILKEVKNFRMHIIDKTSLGSGWTGKQLGVGWARKTIMDEISKAAAEADVILSLDGDTTFSEHYFGSVLAAFTRNPEIHSAAIPYYHKLTSDKSADLAILRYEIYMRYYAINLLRIGCPYAFTALGSAMACTVKAYRRIGGMTPHKSGEDFYFLQKLKKFGGMLITVNEKVYPAARFSSRVFFGTGPAMIKGAAGDWDSYPIYNYRFFDEVAEAFGGFKNLFAADIETPMTSFLDEKFEKGQLWQPLRENSKSSTQFEKACITKIDGLRILQFLKWRQQQVCDRDEENLKDFLYKFYNQENLREILPEPFIFEESSVEVLSKIRDFLFLKEEEWQQKIRILR
jgi:glycosyltransferase involved in cell wall biosynthesis